MDSYDAGLLNDYGGGDVNWWHDYIRAEINRANDFHIEQIATLEARHAALVERVRGVQGRVDVALCLATGAAKDKALEGILAELADALRGEG